MHMHEKRCIKRAGVAGIALRAEGINTYLADCFDSTKPVGMLMRAGSQAGKKDAKKQFDNTQLERKAEFALLHV